MLTIFFKFLNTGMALDLHEARVRHEDIRVREQQAENEHRRNMEVQRLRLQANQQAFNFQTAIADQRNNHELFMMNVDRTFRRPVEAGERRYDNVTDEANNTHDYEEEEFQD